MQWLHGGFELELHRDEAENYYLNLSAPQPCVFIVWRMEEDLAVPKFVTVSYGEAARFMDANEQVDTAPMPRDLCDWASSSTTITGRSRRSAAGRLHSRERSEIDDRR